MSSTETPTAAYVAWWRKSRRDAWEKIADGATEASAFNGLLDMIAHRKSGGESIVLKNGVRPEATANRRIR